MDDSPLIVPLAPSTIPPAVGTGVGAAMGAANAGFQPDTEAIEVNMLFDDDDVPEPSFDDDVDTVDRPLTPESFVMDTDSVHDTENFYQEIENDMPFM